jgi:hypothetical protein
LTGLNRSAVEKFVHRHLDDVGAAQHDSHMPHLMRSTARRSLAVTTTTMVSAEVQKSVDERGEVGFEQGDEVLDSDEHAVARLLSTKKFQDEEDVVEGTWRVDGVADRSWRRS